MGSAFRIGRLSGMDVKIHWTFLLLLAFFAFIGYQASGSPVGALTAPIFFGVGFLLGADRARPLAESADKEGGER
jgi:hypothetical protein